MQAVNDDKVALGIRRRVPFDVYRSLPGTGITSLKEMARSAKHYRYRLENPRKSKPMTLGNSAHTAVTEPHRFIAEYALWDERTDKGRVRPRNGKDWETFEAAHADKRIIRADEHDLAMAMRDAVRGNEDAIRYLRKGDPEVSMCWRDAETERLCKGRLDWLTSVDGCDVLVGLKTARDCRNVQFGNAAAKLGYHLQWAYYRDGYEVITGKAARVVEIVVESGPPHDVVVYVIPADIIEQGRDEYRKLLVDLNECESTRTWPGAAKGEQVLSYPAWAFQSENDLTDLDLEA